MSFFDDYVAGGLFCEQCGTSIDGEEPGHVRVCHTCQLHGAEYRDKSGAPNSGLNDPTVIDRSTDTNAEVLEALERCVDALASLRGEHEPPMTQVVRGRAAIAKAKGGAK